MCVMDAKDADITVREHGRLNIAQLKHRGFQIECVLVQDRA